MEGGCSLTFYDVEQSWFDYTPVLLVSHIGDQAIACARDGAWPHTIDLARSHPTLAVDPATSIGAAVDQCDGLATTMRTLPRSEEDANSTGSPCFAYDSDPEKRYFRGSN